VLGIVVTAILVLAGCASLFVTRVVWRQGWPVMAARRPEKLALFGSTLGVIQHEKDDSLSVATIDLDTGERTHLVSNVGPPTSLALDADWVVWSSCRTTGTMPCAGDTFALRRAGGDPILVLNESATGLVLGGGHVHALHDGAVYVGKPGETLGLHVSSDARGFSNGASAIAGNARSLFVLRPSSLDAWDLETAAHRPLGPGCSFGGMLAADETSVFVVCARASPTKNDTIERVPLDGSPREALGTARDVSSLAPSARGLVLTYDVPFEDDPSSATSTLGVLREPGTPIRVLIERSGWGPIAVRGRDVYLLGWEYVFRTSLP
jgi:hypothetical protein